MAFEYRTTRRVEFCETDLAGIVHFANYNIYMEQTEHEFFRSLGIKLLNEQEDGSIISWPRVSASCNFKAPAYYDDVLDVHLQIMRIGLKSLTMQYEFTREDTFLARGQMKIVCCRFRRGEPLKSIEIPQDYLAKFEESPNPVNGD